MLLDKPALLRKHYGTEDYEDIAAHIRSKDWLCDPPDKPRTSLCLPYYAPDDSLPPIPTPEEIGLVIDSTSEKKHASSPVYRVNDVYAVKRSTGNDVVYEAENLKFLEDHTVRSTKVYAVFRHQRKDDCAYYYLITDWIKGITLDEEKWNNVEKDDQRKIYNKLGEQLRLLRSIPPPGPNYYGRVNNQSFWPTSPFIRTRAKDQTWPGPFHSYEAFLQAMWNTLEVEMIHGLDKWGKGPTEEFTPGMQFAAQNYWTDFDKSSKSGEPKLTHTDLHLGNFMLILPESHVLDPLNALKGIGDFELTIVDWEKLQWLPAWCEIYSTIGGLLGERMEAASEISKSIQPYYYKEALCFASYFSYMADCFSALE